MDNILLSELKKGSVKAYDSLFHKYYGRLCTFAMKFVRDKESAEEIVAEAMVVLWERRDRFDNPLALKSYLYSTVRNASLDFLKESGKKTSLNVIENMTAFEAVDASIVEEEVHATLYQALAALPTKCRRVFELSCIEELKYSEIADDMGISLNTVKSQRARAIQLLRDILKDHPYYVLLFHILLQR